MIGVALLVDAGVNCCHSEWRVVYIFVYNYTYNGVCMYLGVKSTILGPKFMLIVLCRYSTF